MSQAMENMKEVDTQKVQQQVSLLRNIVRIAGNTLILVSEATVSGDKCRAVIEASDWLNETIKVINTQINTLEAVLPKPTVPVLEEVKAPEVSVPGVEGAR